MEHCAGATQHSGTSSLTDQEAAAPSVLAPLVTSLNFHPSAPFCLAQYGGAKYKAEQRHNTLLCIMKGTKQLPDWTPMDASSSNAMQQVTAGTSCKFICVFCLKISCVCMRLLHGRVVSSLPASHTYQPGAYLLPAPLS